MKILLYLYNPSDKLTNMYFEEAIVKTYERNYKDKKVPFNQINLGQGSKFNKNPEKPDKVAVINILDFQDLVKDNGLTKFNEMEAKYKQLQEENLQLKEEIEELTSTAKSLASDVNELKEDKIQLQEELLTYKSHYEDKAEDLTTEKEDSKKLLASIVTLTNKNTELEKENIFLKSRGLFNRIINKQYAKEPDVPEIVEAESKTSEENEAEGNEE